MRRGVLLGIVLLLILTLASTATAQPPEKEKQFVYALSAFDGKLYNSSFCPQSVTTLYLLADERNIIAPRRTEVYFWPLTNEYMADWFSLDEKVQGTLEILQGGRLAWSFPTTKYCIQYPEGQDGGKVYLYEGEAAERQYEKFTKARENFFKQIEDYNHQSDEYGRLLEEWSKKAPGERQTLPPEPPQPPPPFKFVSTGVFEGFVVSLPEGSYTVRVRAGDGSIVAGSEKKLIVFASRRQGIGYVVRPQSRWTVPEQAADPAGVIYAQGESTIYLEPFTQREYRDLYYARLLNPQSQEGREDSWRWVFLQPESGVRLQIIKQGQLINTIDLQPYFAQLTPGPALGYEVVPYDKEKIKEGSPSFTGYKVQLDPGGALYTVRLIDSAGQVVPGSEREIRIIKAQDTLTAFPPAAVPLLAGIILMAWHRRRLAEKSKVRIL
ncbi:MAG: hypothetical protein M1136_02335 [Chloroflexi bacterium]|nr:hypothetical protein [Chloroflexota bacterium]MCL5074477.1 hypothetical protein [Chloroflexota bacterium]